MGSPCVDYTKLPTKLCYRDQAWLSFSLPVGIASDNPSSGQAFRVQMA